MKKLILTMFTAATLVACNSNDPAKDASEVCECSTKARAIEDEAKRAEERGKCTDLQMEKWRNYSDNAEKAKIFNETLKVCTDKFMDEDMEKMIKENLE